MQEGQLFTRQFDNGLVLLGESMPWLSTAAFSILLPAGAAFDPLGQSGLATMTCEVAERGCGSLDSRSFLEAVEMLGASTNNSVSTYHTSYGGSCLSEKLPELLRLYGDLTRRPKLPKAEFSPSKKVCLQELFAQQDDLSQMTLRVLRKQYFGDTLGRWADGELDELEKLNYQDVVDFYKKHYNPRDMILSVAGNFDWDQLVQQVEAIWGDWEAGAEEKLTYALGATDYQHIPQDSQQTHIAFASPTIPFGTDDYFLIRCAVGVLGDGMSSRLFQEVREKRGLCYTVFAGIHSLKDSACITAYAGTTSARAQETLDTMFTEFQRMRDGVTEEELHRLKIQIRTGLMAQQESCRSRAAAIAGDWFYLHRVRSQDEINDLLNGLSVQRVNQFLADNPIEITTAVTVGPEALEMPHGVAHS